MAFVQDSCADADDVGKGAVGDAPVIRRATKERRTDHNTGIVFDSRGELERWWQLTMLERAGAITELRRQVPFMLHAGLPDGGRVPILIRSPGYPNGRHCRLTVDFAYRENGVEVFEDYKAGEFKEADRLRIAIAEAEYGIRVRISGSGKVRKPRSRG